ncbi:MAG: hypothetical protein HY647_04055 [Acidobacteria bacterium]|nr:hypothetical protein [Acidobacteriota bacterium]
MKPLNQVVVVDNKGKIVGSASGALGFSTTVLLKIEDRLIPVALTKNSYSRTGTLFFELANCGGTAWMVPTPNALDTNPKVGPPGNTNDIAKEDVVPVQITIASSFGQSCLGTGGTLEAVPAVPFIDLDTVFTPPFSVRTIP